MSALGIYSEIMSLGWNGVSGWPTIEREETLHLEFKRQADLTGPYNDKDRGEIARLFADVHATLTGTMAEPPASLGKLAFSQILHQAGRLQGHLLGIEGTLDGDEFPTSRDHNYSQMNAYFFSIGGGTDQIQRNIVGERVLGLPKEPDPYRDTAFRDLPH